MLCLKFETRGHALQPAERERGSEATSRVSAPSFENHAVRVARLADARKIYTRRKHIIFLNTVRTQIFTLLT